MARMCEVLIAKKPVSLVTFETTEFSCIVSESRRRIDLCKGCKSVSVLEASTTQYTYTHY